jgi:hypothetical protein
MLDVLHDLERPIEFLKEASRVLRSGGRLSMIEPVMRPLARRFYGRFHEEPVDMMADPFTIVAADRNRDPFDASQAIPSLLFSTEQAQRRFEDAVPSFRVRHVDWQSLLAYPLSGGFQKWSFALQFGVWHEQIDIAGPFAAATNPPQQSFILSVPSEGPLAWWRQPAHRRFDREAVRVKTSTADRGHGNVAGPW